jgi:hypothetical protein
MKPRDRCSMQCSCWTATVTGLARIHASGCTPSCLQHAQLGQLHCCSSTAHHHASSCPLAGIHHNARAPAPPLLLLLLLLYQQRPGWDCAQPTTLGAAAMHTKAMNYTSCKPVPRPHCNQHSSKLKPTATKGPMLCLTGWFNMVMPVPPTGIAHHQAVGGAVCAPSHTMLLDLPLLTSRVRFLPTVCGQSACPPGPPYLTSGRSCLVSAEQFWAR